MNMSSLNQPLNKDLDYVNSLHYLAEISLYKLSHQGPLRRQVLTRNILMLSSYLITTQTTATPEENWLDACIDQLDEEEDYLMEDDPKDNKSEPMNEQDRNDENRLILAFPFDYVSTQQDTTVRTCTLYFI